MSNPIIRQVVRHTRSLAGTIARRAAAKKNGCDAMTIRPNMSLGNTTPVDARPAGAVIRFDGASACR